MTHQIADIKPQVASIDPITFDIIEDYSVLLRNLGIEYSFVDYYLQVGTIDRIQGWILHLSIVRSQIVEVLHIVIPYLVKKHLAFKIAKDKETARNLLDGGLGSSEVGKVVCIYPDSDEIASEVAKDLVNLTRLYSGPTVLTDSHLGGLVYTRYGSFDQIIMSDVSGVEEKYIYDSTNNLIKDTQKMPFELPKDRDWPFSDLARTSIWYEPKILNNVYRPIAKFKIDPRGNVMKSLYLKSLFYVKLCVIKQGRKHMWSDEYKRDIQDRLLWQRELHNLLSPSISLPKAIDFFYENGDAYLVLEYIRGMSLYDKVKALNKNSNTWCQWSRLIQIKVLDIILEITSIVRRLHQMGIVHRDLTPVNFLINKKQKLVLIDIELAYSIRSKKPEPPFIMGTYGFMSPQQMAISNPTVEDDIFGLGALIVNLLTNLSPMTFDRSDLRLFSKNILFFLKDKPFTDLLCTCLSTNPEVRPSLASMEKAIQEYKTTLKQGAEIHSFNSDSIDRKHLNLLIQNAISGLVNEPTLINENLWLSQTMTKGNVLGKQAKDYSISGGFRSGVAGILYFLARAHKSKFDISSCKRSFTKGWQFINMEYLQLLPNISPGLFGGAAGIALALVNGIESGLVDDNQENRSLLVRCLSLSSDSMNVANGTSGQGIAAMKCVNYVEDKILSQLLDGYVDKISHAQNKNGYWLKIEDDSQHSHHNAGFFYGNTGVIWFLLEYSTQKQDLKLEQTSLEAVQRLVDFAKSTKKLIKKQGFQNIINNNQICDCITGICLIYLKAYEKAKLPLYKRIVEDILFEFPRHIVNDNFNQETGLAGLGELYLEAHRILRNEEWKIRASWIAQIFIHVYHIGENGSICWLGNNSMTPTADFLVGNSGIIHFLIRYLNANELGYRVLS